MRLAFPVEECLWGSVLSLGDLFQGLAEMEFIFFSAHFGPQTRGHADEPCSRHVIERAFFKFGFDLAELFAQGFPSLALGNKILLLNGVRFNGTEILDFELVRSAPVDERAFGHAEELRDFDEAFAFGAEGDEFFNNFRLVHKNGMG